ncbi:MAG: hypothetical protein O3A84_16780 [Proteobacteria bacterium]|nr:hypothetical protein [Pseudomonadota bacterium]
MIAGEGSSINPLFSLPLTLLLLAIFIRVPFEASPWEFEAQQFPLAVSLFAVVLLLAIVFIDGRQLIKSVAENGSWSLMARSASKAADFPLAGQFIGYLIAIVLGSIVVGQQIALPVFVFVYLWRWGNYGWKISLGYAVGAAIFIVGFYDKIMNLFFYPSLLFG